MTDAAQVRPATALSEWRHHWLVVFAASMACAVGVTHSYAVGVFMAPIQHAFHWTRGDITAGLLVVSVVSVVLAPFFGMMIDRFGPRRVGLPGLVLYCGAVAGLGLAGPSIWTWWALWVFVAVGSVSIKPTVWTAGVVSHFERGRGVALAATLCGTGVGSALTPMITDRLITAYGWRGAYFGLGAIGLAISLPLAITAFHDARDKAVQSGAIKTRGGAPVPPGLTAREGMATWRFFRLALAGLLTTAALYAMVVHFVPILSAGGVSRKAAVGIAGLIGLSSLIARLACGFLIDRFDARAVGAVVFALPVAGCVLLLNFHGSPVQATAIAIVVGLSVGGEVDIISYLSARYFGLRAYGTIFGTMVGLLSLGVGMGPFLAGVVFDRTGGYGPALWALIPLLLLSATLIALMGAYPSFAAPAEPPTP
ncbi:MAG: hypothetical protein JWP35_1968 [Caulobacter sp.]|nr:hypothetical protein [Caulobacter sp.]